MLGWIPAWQPLLRELKPVADALMRIKSHDQMSAMTANTGDVSFGPRLPAVMAHYLLGQYAPIAGFEPAGTWAHIWRLAYPTFLSADLQALFAFRRAGLYPGKRQDGYGSRTLCAGHTERIQGLFVFRHGTLTQSSWPTSTQNFSPSVSTAATPSYTLCIKAAVVSCYWDQLLADDEDEV
ncbi:hypothetical protein CPB83DRAFT_840195 [Crepidotus variabilis]|uniref:Uncharacterized protein n=1 Tax=Crepidotus variabilis TaxID=179855 RepID=A0A9P6JJF9_9AGAR|nr:hypothetical protein CPB83DRAFT_840195 [Crepidotus variabilis]